MRMPLRAVVLVVSVCWLVVVGALEAEQRDVDYMGWWMDKASPQWSQQHAAEQPIQVISAAEPRAVLHRNFLSAAEADHLIQLAAGRLRDSQVVNAAGGSVSMNVRTSSDASIRRGADEVVAAIEQRIADWTGAPVDHGEGLTVLRYEVGEHYAPHHDFFYDERSILNGGQRVATVLLYLTDGRADYSGGETTFPKSLSKPLDGTPREELSECARQGVAVKASKGDALLFYSVSPDGDAMDEFSLHTSCPVIQGIKYVATKWLRSDVVRD